MTWTARDRGKVGDVGWGGATSGLAVGLEVG